MNKIVKTLALLLFFSFAGAKSYAQFVVKIRPDRPAVMDIHRRPPPPSRDHVWVEEDWVPQNGSYVWHGGYWAAPPRRGAFYVQGHWRETRRGSIWVPGHWK